MIEQIKDKFIYIDNNDELGYIIYKIDKGVLDIMSTFVKPEYRGKGVASILMEYVYRYSLNKGYKIRCTCSYAKKWFDDKNIIY